MIRLNKYLSMCGVSSRRGAEKLIADGRIRVNGKVVTELGTVVDEKTDRVEVDNRHVTPVTQHLYILLNKPRHVMTTMSDPHGRPTVAELLEGVKERVNPIGRLDFDTKGVLILTNDGELAHRLAHPRYQVVKVYEATVVGSFTRTDARKIESGVTLEDGKVGHARVQILSSEKNVTHIRLTLTEGRKHEVKQLCQAVGHPVRRLCRVRFAGITTHGLKLGAWRRLSRAEIKSLKDLVGLSESQ